jgi:hypothetical protein
VEVDISDELSSSIENVGAVEASIVDTVNKAQMVEDTQEVRDV